MDKAETRAEEIDRLQREIGERQMRLQWLVLGDPSQRVGLTQVGEESASGWRLRPSGPP